MGELCAHESGTSTCWGRTSYAVVHDLRLSTCARLVYTSLTTRANARGEVAVCHETIARNLGRSRPWVCAGFNELEKLGLIQVERIYVDGLQRPSRYVLLDGLRQVSRDSAGRSCTESVRELCFEQDMEPSEPVGKTTCRPAESPAVAGANQADQQCQPATIRSQPADTSHDSGSHTLSQDRARAYPSPDQSSGHKPGIPENWQPGADDLAWAMARQPQLDVQVFTENFVLTCLAKGYRYANTSAAWRLWISDPKSPLPLIQPAETKPGEPVTSSGETDHARSSAHDSSGRKILRNCGRGERKIFSGGGGGTAVDLGSLNAGRAADCLGRILARRGVHPSA